MSAKKTLAILSLFNQNEYEYSVDTISDKLNLPKSSVYRYLKILKEERYVHENTRGNYQLGFRIFELGNIACLNYEISYLAYPYLKQLTDITGETSVIVLNTGLTPTCIACVFSSNPVKVTSTQGQILPFHAGASQKVILAYMPEKTIDILSERNMIKKFTENTIVDLDKLKKHMKEIRKNGYASSVSEQDIGVQTYAIPIFSNKGNVIASLSLAGPQERMRTRSDEYYVSNLLNFQNDIESVFGNHNVV